MSFWELKNEEYVLNLAFCFNYFDDSQSVGRWVSGRWVGGLKGWWLVVLIKPNSLRSNVNSLLSMNFICKFH